MLVLCLKPVPSVCTVFVTLVQCFRVARAGNVPNLPVFVLVLVPLVQCFAWSARAMYPFARVRTRTGTSCTVLCLVSPGNVPICPCSYPYWYPLYSASLGQHGQCAYLPVFVLVLCVNRCTVCTVLVLLVQRFLGLARAMYIFARVRTRTGTPLYPLYMPARVMHLLTRACARTVLVPSHSMYCIVPLAAKTELYGRPQQKQSCTDVRVRLVCVGGLIVRAHSALLCMCINWAVLISFSCARFKGLRCCYKQTNTVSCMVASSGLYGTVSYGRAVQMSECRR